MKVSLRSGLVAVTLAAGLSLTGCSLPGNVLMGTGPLPESGVFRQAGIRGTEYCIQNDSLLRMRIQWRGFPAPIDIPRSSRQCNSGYETGTFDVYGTLQYLPVANHTTASAIITTIPAMCAPLIKSGSMPSS